MSKANWIFAGLCCVALVALGGCEPNPPGWTSYHHYIAGVDWEKRGRLASAEHSYYMALDIAEKHSLGPEWVVRASYSLGRVKRLVCKPREAEVILRRALEVSEKAGSPDAYDGTSKSRKASPDADERTSRVLFELSHLYYDQGRYGEAVPLMAWGFAIAEKLGLESGDSRGLANTLHRYADALRKVNRLNEAAPLYARLKSLSPDFHLDAGWNVTAIPVGRGPAGVAVGAGAVWVSLRLDNALLKIDPKTNAIMVPPIAVGKKPAGVAISEDGVWIAHTGDGTVARIDVKTNRVVAMISVGGEPDLVAVAPRAVWVTNAASALVSRIDPQTNKVVATIHVGRPTGLAVVGDAIWVANYEEETVLRIDSSTNQLLGQPIKARKIWSMAVGEGAVWAAKSDNQVIRMDPRTGEIVASISVGRRPSFVAVGAGAVWVTNHGDGTVSRIDPQTSLIVAKPIPVGLSPVWLAVGEGAVWVSNRCSETLSRIDLNGSW